MKIIAATASVLLAALGAQTPLALSAQTASSNSGPPPAAASPAPTINPPTPPPPPLAFTPPAPPAAPPPLQDHPTPRGTGEPKLPLLNLFSAAPAAGENRPAGGSQIETETTLSRGILAEEGNMDLAVAMAEYQSVVARYDGLRPTAAMAVFRLGECYRKLGRWPEAKVWYSRILREFPDQRELSELSQRYLFGNAAPAHAGTGPHREGASQQAPAAESDRSTVQPSAQAAGLAAQMEALLTQQHRLQAEQRLLEAQLAQTPPDRPAAPKAPVPPEPAHADSWQALEHSANPKAAKQRRGLQNVLKELDLVDRERLLARRTLAEREKDLQLARGSQPEHLPAPASKDPLYQATRDEYARSLVAAATEPSPEAKTAVERARQALLAWVNQIYLPRLEEQVRQAELEVKLMEERASELNARAEKYTAELGELETH